MNNLKCIRPKLVLTGMLLISAIIFTGCGKQPSDNADLSAEIEGTETQTVTESADTSAEAKDGNDKKEETIEEKRAHFADLYKENAVLWNDYNDIIQEIAYYESVYHDEIAAESSFKSAADKLKETREDNPIRLRPVKDFHTEVGEVQVPEIADEELDKWIAELEEQNNTIREQTDFLIPRRDAVKAYYGAEMNLDGVTYED